MVVKSLRSYQEHLNVLHAGFCSTYIPTLFVFVKRTVDSAAVIVESLLPVIYCLWLISGDHAVVAIVLLTVTVRLELEIFSPSLICGAIVRNHKSAQLNISHIH